MPASWMPPGAKWNGEAPPVPDASFISFEGRFSIFCTPEDIVGGTWLSPADWPQGRKRAAVDELTGRMNRIASRYSIDRVPDEAYLNFGLIDCSKRMNAMFGGPDSWPRAAFGSLLTATGYKGLTLGKSFAYSDPYLTAGTCKIPKQVAEQIRKMAANWWGVPAAYRDAADILCKQPLLYTERTAESFTVLPFVNVAEFIDEIRRSDRITVDLYADFDIDGVPRAHLGETPISLNDLDAEKIRLNLDRAARSTITIGRGGARIPHPGCISRPPLSS